MAIVFLPAVALCYALIPAVYYGMLDAKRQNPLHSILVFDLGGITHFTGENQFPVAWSAEQTALLTSECYDPVRWDSYWHVPPCPFVMQRLERPDDLIFGTPRLVAAWWRAVAGASPRLSQPPRDLHVAIPRPLEPGAAGLGLGEAGRELRQESLFPAAARAARRAAADAAVPAGSLALLAVAVGASAWRARATPAGAFAVGVTASAIVYVMTFFVVGVAADFRYAYWCVLATLAGAVAARAGTALRAAPALYRVWRVRRSSRGASDRRWFSSSRASTARVSVDHAVDDRLPELRRRGVRLADRAARGQARIVGAPGKAHAAIEDQAPRSASGSGSLPAGAIMSRRTSCGASASITEVSLLPPWTSGFRRPCGLRLRQVEGMDDAGIEREIAGQARG